MLSKETVKFKVTYECRNCGIRFSIEYEGGYKIIPQTYLLAPYVEYNGSLPQIKDKTGFVHCSNCQVRDTLVLRKRVPISDYIDGDFK